MWRRKSDTAVYDNLSDAEKRLIDMKILIEEHSARHSGKRFRDFSPAEFQSQRDIYAHDITSLNSKTSEILQEAKELGIDPMHPARFRIRLFDENSPERTSSLGIL